MKFFCLVFSISISSIFPTNILLRNGDTIKGNVINQDDTYLIFSDERGDQKTIKKNLVLKVVYKNVSEKELAKIRQEEEQKLKNQTKQFPIKDQNLSINQNNSISGNVSKIILNVHPETICEVHSLHPQWYWLYGNLSITDRDNWMQKIPRDVSSIKIKDTSNWKDTLITIILGSLTSITRRTIQIEVCDLN